jgi:hypothetical protein
MGRKPSAEPGSAINRRARATSGRPLANGVPELLTADEVAMWLKTTVGAVYAKAERGNLPGATRLGRRLYFFKEELVTFAEQGRVPLVADEMPRALGERAHGRGWRASKT